MPAFSIPDDATITIQRTGREWLLAIVRPGGPATLASVRSCRSGICAVVTHDPGLTRPDARGEALIHAVLSRPASSAFLLFDTLLAATACRNWLRGLH